MPAMFDDVSVSYSEFSMRKTYWLLLEDFDEDCREDALRRLRKAIDLHVNCSEYDQEMTEKMRHVLCDLDLQDLVETPQAREVVTMLNPLWTQQTACLQSIMAGKQLSVCHLCRIGASCRKRPSCRRSVPRLVFDAVEAVEKRLKHDGRPQNRLQFVPG